MTNKVGCIQRQVETSRHRQVEVMLLMSTKSCFFKLENCFIVNYDVACPKAVTDYIGLHHFVLPTSHGVIALLQVSRSTCKAGGRMDWQRGQLGPLNIYLGTYLAMNVEQDTPFGI